MSRNQWLVIAVVAVAVVVVFGCFGGFLLAYLMGGSPPTALAPVQPSRTPVATSVATDTPVPSVTTPPECTFDGAYVADVTVPDGTEFPPGASFTKTWRVRNTGTCPWVDGTQLVFASGEPMGGPGAVDIPVVAAGSDADISVDLVAPAVSGSYVSTWQLRSPEGENFGSQIYVRIEVQQEATVQPTQTPTAEPTDTPTGTPTSTPLPPDLYVTDLAFGPDVLVKNAPIHILATLHNDGAEALSNVMVRVENHFSHPLASCDNMDMVDVMYETTVDLDAGALLPVDFSVQIDTAWEHLICVKVDPDNAVGESDEGNNAQGQAILVGTLTSIPLDEANTGSIREDGYANYPNAQPGDASNNRRVHGFLSWDLSPISTGAYVLHAHVTWGTHCFHGGSAGSCGEAPHLFPALGILWVRAYYYGTLDVGDFAAAGLSGGTLLTSYTAQPAGSFDVTDAVADALATGHPFQVYSLFEYGTDSNGTADGVRFLEGGGANTLTVVHMP